MSNPPPLVVTGLPTSVTAVREIHDDAIRRRAAEDVIRHAHASRADALSRAGDRRRSARRDRQHTFARGFLRDDELERGLAAGARSVARSNPICVGVFGGTAMTTRASPFASETTVCVCASGEAGFVVWSENWPCTTSKRTERPARPEPVGPVTRSETTLVWPEQTSPPLHGAEFGTMVIEAGSRTAGRTLILGDVSCDTRSVADRHDRRLVRADVVRKERQRVAADVLRHRQRGRVRRERLVRRRSAGDREDQRRAGEGDRLVRDDAERASASSGPARTDCWAPRCRRRRRKGASMPAEASRSAPQLHARRKPMRSGDS